MVNVLYIAKVSIFVPDHELLLKTPMEVSRYSNYSSKVGCVTMVFTLHIPWMPLDNFGIRMQGKPTLPVAISAQSRLYSESGLWVLLTLRTNAGCPHLIAEHVIMCNLSSLYLLPSAGELLMG